MFGTYIGNDKMLIKTVYGGTLVVPSTDLSITPSLILSGSIEEPLTKYLCQNVRQGHIVIDIGANVGYFTVLLGLAVGPTGKVYAFEPNPYLYPYLFDNLSINYLHDRVITQSKAIYSCNKTLEFYASKRYMGNSSIKKHDHNYLKNYMDDIEKVKVQAVALDKELIELENIDFLKIDIEGGEFHAFRGFHQLLISDKIRRTIFELNKPMLQGDWAFFVELLKTYKNEYGKQFFILTENGNELEIDLLNLINIGGYPYAIMK